MSVVAVHVFRLRQARPLELLALLAIAMTAVGCRPASDPEGVNVAATAEKVTARDVSMSSEQIQHGGVRWEPVQAGTMTESVEIPGRLVPNEDQTARLSAPARGRVVTVGVGIGDRVSPDQSVVTLQSESATAARADYEKARAELKARQVAATYARIARERAERLLELKAMSRQEMERARTDDEVATSARTQAEVDVERSRAMLAQLDVDNETGNITLKAPFAGVVLRREAVPASVVDAGAPLVTISDVSTLWLDMAATERVARVLLPGARIQFTASAVPSETFEATVQNIGGALDAATRTVQVRGLVRNRSSKLRPEMFATVTLQLGEPRPGIAVPAGAVQLLDQRAVVFVARPDDKGGARFERRDVEIGARTETRTQIVRGLAPGDVVVTNGAFTVKSEFARLQVPGGS